jgi:hypothetical protein
MNPYTYTLNNPMLYIDPTGEKWECGYSEFGDDTWYWGFGFGDTRGLTYGFSGGANVGAGFTIGPSASEGATVAVGPNAGCASAGLMSACAGASVGVGFGGHAGWSRGASLGWGYGSTDGWFSGWTKDPSDPANPDDEERSEDPSDPTDPDDEEQDEDHTDSRTSHTPEDKFGPAGYDAPGTPDGSERRYVPAGQTMGYRVEFWNKKDAPVPTQDAIIMDELAPDVFDLSTLEFTRIGFLDWDVRLPGGQLIDSRIDCRPEMNIAVEVRAGLGMEVPGFANNADITDSTLVW